MKTLPLVLALLTVHSVAQPNDELIENGTNFYSNCAAVETLRKGRRRLRK